MYSLPAFYFKTSVLFVDDDKNFLDTISNAIDSNFSILSQYSSKECLDFINNYNSLTEKHNFFKPCIELELNNDEHSIIDFDISNILSIKDYPYKKNEISSIVIDYCMPTMNGIELCQKFKPYSFKKILLTGKADFKDAITAFNNGLIDRFIGKYNDNLIEDILISLKSLEMKYFCEKSQLIIKHLEAEMKIPLTDPIFIDFFNALCEEKNIIEYYLISKTGSFLLIDDRKQEYFLIVYTKESLDYYKKLFPVNETEYLILNTNLNSNKIPFFGINQDITNFEPENWDKYFFKASELNGRDKYYWSLSNNF